MASAQFEQIRESTRRIGENSYLEVTRKRIRDAQGEHEFLLLSRGFFESDGTKRWTKFVTIPDEPGVRDWLAEALRTV